MAANGQSPPPARVLDDIVKLVASMNDMICNFRSMRDPIVESSNSVPQASEQLDKVTQETERVTNRMLDLVETMTERGMETAGHVDELLSHGEGLNEEQRTMLQAIQANSEEDQNDIFMIMDALQFQDITSQQINHANSILDTIDSKLQSLLRLIGEAFEVHEEVERSFDPEATTTNRKSRQAMVDSLIKETQPRKDTE